MVIPISIDPDDFPPDDYPPPSQLPGLGRFLRRRYTCNVAVTEQMNASDFLHDVVFVGSRMFFAQAQNGRISLKNKKPAPWALVTEAISIGETAIDVDNVSEWIDNVDNFLLISPHTDESEIRTVTASNYSSSQNSVALSSSGGLFTITGFSGCDGANTPATATIEVTADTDDTDCEITLEGITFAFRTSSTDTVASISSYIAGVIATHPALYRRFSVEWDEVDTVTLTARFGTLTLNSGLQFAKTAPAADPSTAPTLTAAGGGSLAAGEYAVAYSYENAAGETLLSPYKTVTLGANEEIDVDAITPLPAGVTSVKWYCSPEANSVRLRYVSTNNGAAFTISSLPRLSAPLPPDLNRTGAEVIKLAFVFSDRAETRSAATRSNVLKGTFNWLLGTKEKTINRVDLKYRDASQDWRLVELRLRDDAHIDKIKKVSPVALNGQSIDNTDQAYRIASGELAERCDANFFYKWEGTREALLLQEGDVGAITDNGSGVINLPVRIEEIEFDPVDGSLPTATFTGRKYSSRLYDDSIVEATIPVVSES